MREVAGDYLVLVRTRVGRAYVQAIRLNSEATAHKVVDWVMEQAIGERATVYEAEVFHDPPSNKQTRRQS
jgi:hypothetical protein